MMKEMEDRSIWVAVTTLDELIARRGAPRFTKIDVEGCEPEVLAGLSIVDMGPSQILPWIRARTDDPLDWGDIYARVVP
ncbi:MAG TPA: FkbM family methyltransferase [Acidimicrobiales bacterium]|nr:FkbM family methyltransferase [Acidimicrobiales bacterium]